jgi:hypothetical protein
MSNHFVHGCIAVLLSVAMASCGGGKEGTAKMQAAMDSMTGQRDSAIRAMDSTGKARAVDTTKLRAAKTESIRAKARKSR